MTTKNGEKKPIIIANPFKEIKYKKCGKVIQGIIDFNYIYSKRKYDCPHCLGCKEDTMSGPYCAECYESIIGPLMGKESLRLFKKINHIFFD